MEEKLKELKVTVRCVPLDGEDEPGKCIFTGQPSNAARRVREVVLEAAEWPRKGTRRHEDEH